MEDIFLLSFLRWKKYDVQKAFEALYNFYILKEKHSGEFLDRKPSELAHVLEMNHLSVMPLRDPDGCNVGILRIGFHDIKTATVEELFATVLCMGLVTNDIEAYQVSGVVLIFDCKNLTFDIAQKLFRLHRILFALAAVRCLPCRIKGIHVVNLPQFYRIFYNIVKILLPQKILQRLHLHTSDLVEFHKHVPPEVLPEELGGILGPINNKDYINFFLSKQTYVEQINNGGIKVKHEIII
ncbi:alpha-tocopherol transfer protein-like isoform X1 [Stegodyphus dumicola]|uniref:alpha-tocopherol transfer protein-like isoform X1 n=1 Tax=Stegodyphus dumicola TaxID=202533 RepID=UPI0015B01222|nr:alpha-tocopherol transfer protein-like isoform X1 [Stegodyphus dumicola]